VREGQQRGGKFGSDRNWQRQHCARARVCVCVRARARCQLDLNARFKSATTLKGDNDQARDAVLCHRETGATHSTRWQAKRNGVAQRDKSNAQHAMAGTKRNELRAREDGTGGDKASTGRSHLDKTVPRWNSRHGDREHTLNEHTMVLLQRVRVCLVRRVLHNEQRARHVCRSVVSAVRTSKERDTCR